MKTLSASLVAILFLAGCASDEPERETPMAGEPEIAVDPVTGAEVRTDSPWKTQWNDHWYYFGSEASLRKFESDPAAYVREEGAPKKTRRKVYPHELN